MRPPRVFRGYSRAREAAGDRGCGNCRSRAYLLGGSERPVLEGLALLPGCCEGLVRGRPDDDRVSGERLAQERRGLRSERSAGRLLLPLPTVKIPEGDY